MSAERKTSPVRPTPDRPSSPPPLTRRPGTVVASPAGPAQRFAATGRNLYSIVLIDVAGSAARDNHGHKRMRDDLYGIVAEVTEENDINLESLEPDDTGDGLRLIIPPDLLRSTRVVDAFVAGLATGLREHRKYASETGRIRMRTCFDLGVLEKHRRSWTGDTLVRAARLIDAQQLRHALHADPDADLVAVVSDEMYKIVRHGSGYIPPDCFQEIRVRVKEFDGRAWLLAPAGSCWYGACRQRSIQGGSL